LEKLGGDKDRVDFREVTEFIWSALKEAAPGKNVDSSPTPNRDKSVVLALSRSLGNEGAHSTAAGSINTLGCNYDGV
jgi:hypothetical protein